MPDQKFAHLHLHTDYSLLDGAIQIKPLAKRVAEMEMPACAITDHGNLFGAISFYNAMKAQGVKPIIGCEMYFTRGSRLERSSAKLKPGEKAYFHLVLLAKDLEGYRNLVRLTSKSYTEGFYYKPRIDLELLSQYGRGLIGLSACLSGVPSALLARGAYEEAEAATYEFADVLGKGNYFLEIQDHDLDAQKSIRKPLMELSRRTGVPLVATNDAHYLNPEDARAHDVLVCIGSGKTVQDPHRLRYGTPTFYVRSPEEMWRIFGAELPDALTRTIEIAEMCDVKLPAGVNHVPVYPIPATDAGMSVEDYFERVVRDGFEQRRARVWETALARNGLRRSLADYQERISREIAMIKQMGFASYFLIVWDFIRYAKERAIPVGPGRGSAAGSLVAYCLDITDIDPLQYDLLFERFLNPERVSMPDIDIDFCVRGREDVIRHVSDLYGRDSVCQIITFGTLASKAAIKDVGRALNMPYVEVERIAKLIPPPVRGRNVTITQSLEQVPELRAAFDGDSRVRELIDLARRLEGCARHSSVHAAGVVISPLPLDELIPVSVSSRQELTTQYAMSDLEKTGMLKMDFLALTALTVISDCLKTVKQSLAIEIDWEAISLDDAKTMRLFAEGRTEAVFQFESQGMQEICRRLKPKGLEDLAALNALYRPGPLDGGMVDDFIERHHGHRHVRYIVPEMKELLSNTYGIIVYQEQIMQLAQKLAGYSLGEADLMRRAMGKKKREEMALHEKKFVSGSVERGIKKEKAEQIFSLMAQFADYGFNRSHSVAYAYLAFQTAYLKAHYPEHFYAAVLSNELEDASKVFKYSNELRGQGIKLLPPDVNESDGGFTPLRGAIRYGLAAIRGVGQASVETIINARRLKPFRTFFDFAERVGTRGVNRRVLESLITSGAFDSLDTKVEGRHSWRARLFACVDAALANGIRVQQSLSLGQNALFGYTEESELDQKTDGDLPETDPWTAMTLLAGEKRSLGSYITGHPLEIFGDVLRERGYPKTPQLTTFENGSRVTLGGIITGLQTRTTKKNDQFALMRVEDECGGVKCVVWPEAYAKFKKTLADDTPIIVSGTLEANEDGSSIVVEDILKLDELRQRRAKALILRCPSSDSSMKLLEGLFEVLNGCKGGCDVLLEMHTTEGVLVRARAPHALRVEGSLELEKALRQLGCHVDWRAESPHALTL